MVARMHPTGFMRRQANRDLLDRCEIRRNEGAGGGWVQHLVDVPCSKVVPNTQPPNTEPSDATTAQAEVVEFRLPIGTSVRIGDRLVQASTAQEYTIGAGNFGATWRSLLRVQVARPTAATPRQQITFFRPNPDTGAYSAVHTNVVQLALSQSQPTETAGGQLLTGWVFVPPDMPPLDVQVGDVFDYGGQPARITSITPATEQRREATFVVNVGGG
jgi:hypothetical protein